LSSGTSTQPHLTPSQSTQHHPVSADASGAQLFSDGRKRPRVCEGSRGFSSHQGPLLDRKGMKATCFTTAFIPSRAGIVQGVIAGQKKYRIKVGGTCDPWRPEVHPRQRTCHCSVEIPRGRRHSSIARAASGGGAFWPRVAGSSSRLRQLDDTMGTWKLWKKEKPIHS
jgi:hypothetical protein